MNQTQAETMTIKQLETEKERLSPRVEQLKADAEEAEEALREARRALIQGERDDITQEQARLSGLRGALEDAAAWLDDLTSQIDAAKEERRHEGLRRRIAAEEERVADAEAEHAKAYRSLEKEIALHYGRIDEAAQERRAALRKINDLRRSLGEDPDLHRSLSGAAIAPPEMGAYARAVGQAVTAAAQVKERLDRKARNRAAQPARGEA